MDSMFITAFGDDNLEELSDLSDLTTTAFLPRTLEAMTATEQAAAAHITPDLPRRGNLAKNWHLLHTLSRATAIARHYHTPPVALPTTDVDGLRALQQIAQRGATQKVRRNWQPQLIPAFDYTYAAPLSPLKERDEIALAELFQRDDMYAIETDVTHRLLQLLPEPCWEDDALEFLKDFL